MEFTSRDFEIVGLICKKYLRVHTLVFILSYSHFICKHRIELNQSSKVVIKNLVNSVPSSNPNYSLGEGWDGNESGSSHGSQNHGNCCEGEGFRFTHHGGYTQKQVDEDIVGDSPRDHNGSSVALSKDGKYVAIGATVSKYEVQCQT